MFHKLIERCGSRFPAVLVICLLVATFCCAASSAAQSESRSSLATAKTELDRGDLESSEKHLWDILSVEPTNEQALVMLGTIRVRQQRFTEAEALFRRVLQLNPKSIAASRGLAASLVDQGKQDEAIRQYKETIELDPRDSSVKIEVAKLYLARNDFADGLATLDTIKLMLPVSAVPLKAACLLGLGRRADAEAFIPRVRDSRTAALDLAQVFVEGHDANAALRLLGFVTPNKSIAAREHYLRGRAYREKNQMVAAVASFRESLTDDPKSAETLVAMAEVLAVQNKHADSFEMLQKARVVAPDSVEVLRHLIVEAMECGKNGNALSAAQELQTKSSELSDRYLAASVMIQQKQYLPASHILEDYTAQRPDDAKALLGLGIAYLALLRYADARQALEHSLQIEPNIAETEYQLGVVLAQQGDRRNATQHWEKAVALEPRHAQALFSLGTMYLEAGELKKAHDAFARSLVVNPNNMKTEYDLALVLNKLGNSQEAKVHLERYRQMQAEEHGANGNPPESTDRQ
ncbi:MAG: tetratricopeptide repeat protein [Terriglobales bacterium]